MLQDTLSASLRAQVEGFWTSDAERALLLQVNGELTPAWRERLEQRHCWQYWSFSPGLLRAVVSALQEAPVARAIAADDHEALDALIQPLEAKYAGKGDASWDARLEALLWLRAEPMGHCCVCGAYMGGNRVLGACRHGCA
jgi:hypothetical protein